MTGSDAPDIPAVVETESPEALIVAMAPPAETQWSIVSRQYRKNRAAVWGLRGVFLLGLLAIYTPVIASGLPFVWQPPGEAASYPWFSKMFDVIYWENGVDRFFNFLMIAVPVGAGIVGLARGYYGLLGRRGVPYSEVMRRKVLKRTHLAVVGVAAVIAIAQMVGVGALVSSSAYIDYREQEQRFSAAREAADERLAEAQANGTPEQVAAADAAYAATAFRVVRTPIPYGHREQLPGADDQFLGVMNFDRGEVHLLGTDEIGRDIFTRLIYGTRISLTVGLVAVAIYVTIGTILGAIAGFVGGWTDIFIMRAVEIVICIPGLFLILTIIALFGSRSIFMIMFAIGIVGWTGIARLVRGEFIRERGKEYVTAAKSLGISNTRTLFRHVLPNALGPVIVAATFGVASAIIVESTLSFLGLGDVSVPSWGQILDDGRKTKYWHLIIPPGVAIFITVTLLNLVGDGLRDALDPKLRA